MIFIFRDNKRVILTVPKFNNNDHCGLPQCLPTIVSSQCAMATGK